MANCPNINLDSWKNLVATRGEDIAYYLWDKYEGNVPESESRESIVKSGLKATSILQSPKADQFFNSVIKNKISGEFFWKKMQADLGIPKDQIELLKQYNTTDRDELITNMLANYSYAVEINIARDQKDVKEGRGDFSQINAFTNNGFRYIASGLMYAKYPENNEDAVQEITKKEFNEQKELFIKQQKGTPTQYYSNLTVPGGTNYTENEIATPAITPSIKGHAQFATDKGIGWFRSDDKAIVETPETVEDELDLWTAKKVGDNVIVPTNKPTKTRRILEVQSDLFQKGRDKQLLAGYNIGTTIETDKGKFKILDVFKRAILDNQGKETGIEEVAELENLLTGIKGKVKTSDIILKTGNKSENQFLQLLNKGSNWVTFFVKSIIQDSAKKGYEKVLFPSGNTASKIEGHSTLEEFKKQKEDRIKELEDNLYYVNVSTATKVNRTGFKTKEEAEKFAKENSSVVEKSSQDEYEINQLKQELERVEKEGFGALKPIYNFYETTVANVLKKQGYSPKQVTDEYGNTWNEIEIVPEREQQSILLQKEEMPASKASTETLNKVKQVAKDMGVVFQDLLDYAKGNPSIDTKSVNGLADLVKGVIAIASGKENVALTEEMIHVATAILEQTNPELVTAMISQIGKYKIYKATLEAYKDNKNYQLSNGKPDIRKIKKEAVDKLIAEHIINRSEGSTEFPELMEKETLSLIENWWESIKSAIRSLFGKTKVDLFDQAAQQIMTGNVGARYGQVKEGVSQLFDSNPELASIGTPEQYSAYLDSIFPDSKVKDILKHTTSASVDKFKKGTGRLGEGVYLAAPDYKMYDKAGPNVYRAIVNISNLKRYDTGQFNIVANNQFPTQDEYSKEPQRKLQEQDKTQGVNAYISTATTGTEYNVFEPEQIHILGNKQDLEGFKSFMQTAPATFKGEGVFFQAVEPNEAVDKIYNTIETEANKIVGPIPATYDSSGKLIKKRHYTYNGVEISKSVTEKIKEGQKMPERTPEQKAIDDQKRDWGTEGHDYLENYIQNNLIDKNGYALENPLDEPIASALSAEVKEPIENFAKELIGSYPKGTRFLLEKKVVNVGGKETLASKMDFIAIEPVTNSDGTKDAKVDILDWKFMNINKEKEHDVPWYKKNEWVPQMGEYSKIMYTYGVTRKQLRKSRMMPFHANYSDIIPGQKDSGLQMTSIEIGKLDNTKETNMYLLPVPTPSESTGNPKIDKLIKSLMHEYDKLWKKSVSEKEKLVKEIQLNKLSDAIRLLHLQLNFEPLYAVGKTFLNNAKKTIDSLTSIDYSKLSEEEIDKRLKDLLQIEASAKKYADLDNIFLSHFPKQGLTEEGKKTLDLLEDLSSATERMMDPIKKLQKEFAVWKAVKEGITTEKIGLPAEVEIDVASKTFLEPSTLSSRIINLATNLIMRAKSLVEIKTNKMVDAFGELLIPLEKEARAAGKTAFEMIGNVNNGSLSLIKKIDKEFWKKMTEAKTAKDKQFFLDNMDVEEYNKRAKELIDNTEKELNDVVFSSDPAQDSSEREYRITKLKDSLDINRPTFNGYKLYQFNRLFKELMYDDKHLSKEYKEMARSEAALKMWNFFTNLNERARDMGYLNNKAMSFFPLMEASYIQKFSNSSDILKESKDFFADMWTVREAEKVNFANIDEETYELKREVPKYFTITDRAVSQLSTDLNKVGVLWIKALNEYENARNLENTLLTLHSVEKAKGRILIDKNQNIIFEDGSPMIDEKNNKNADILMTIIDDQIYGIRENSGSLGNIQIGNLSEKIGKTKEGKEKTKLSIKKGFDNSNKLVQALAVGLKPLVAIPNYFGNHFQMLINSGGFYKWNTYKKNHAMLLSGVGVSTIDKGLIDITIPLNGDVTTEKRRKLAWKQSPIKYLGTWTFQDVMMITNSAPERLHEFTNAKSFNDNSMVVDGKIVNIRQYLRKQDRKAREAGLSYEERRALEKSFDSRVNELKNTKSLPKIAVIENDKVVIPGVSDEELSRYRTTIIEFGRQITSQMSETNKADYRRDAIFKSFMMFKNWIVKQVGVRTLDVKKNVELDEWQYGRARAFAKTWFRLGIFNINGMRQVMLGTDEGLAVLKEMIDEKRKAHFLKTGQELEITDEEFYDLMRTQINNQMKELGLLIGLMILVIAAKAAEPPEDATELEKNRYKWWAKALNKISDELAFYYNPISTESITKGSLVPALGLLSKTQKAMWSLTKEVYGVSTDDQELIDKSYPTKYFLDIIPGASQFQREVLPYIDPELAKSMGIRVSAEARRQ